MGKLIIFSAPSGSGKTTIVRELLRRIPQLEFSISATSRAPRGTERDGVDYYFLSPDEFRRAVDEERFVEWEEVYAGTCYGTLRSELDRIWGKGHTILFDVDVLGGSNLKRIFGADACSVFIMPPSIEELERRLELRGTDAPEVIAKRVAKAEFELTKAPEFDHVVVNDVLDMSKIESNSFVVEAKPFNLGQTLAEVDDIVRFQAEQSGLRLYTDHDDVRDADLLGSALYLKKILVNLYSNAIKYNKPAGGEPHRRHRGLCVHDPGYRHWHDAGLY